MPKKSKKTKKPGVKRPRNDSALKKKFEILQELKNKGIERDGRKCIRRMSVNEETGEVVYCERWAIAGGTVCPKHGGNAPQVMAAAKSRLLELYERKIERLNEISEQNGHMPSALGATQALINRVAGKVGDAPKKEGGGITINIGAGLVSGKATQIRIPARAESADIVEGETVKDDEQ